MLTKHRITGAYAEGRRGVSAPKVLAREGIGNRAFNMQLVDG